MSFDLKQLRRDVRQQRRQLTVFQQRHAETAIFQHLIQQAQFKCAQHIGIYLDAFGEVQTRRIILHCFKQQKKVYLPMICNMNQQLKWVKISSYQYHNRRFYLHRLGMLEPKSSRGHAIQQLDLLLMPLVACDLLGHRVGMGGGFYDRSLATAPQHPFRLGLAHDLQLVTQPLPTQPWDQALDALITPSKVYYF